VSIEKLAEEKKGDSSVSKQIWGTLAFLLLVGFVTELFAAEPEEICSVEGITEYRLDNGLQILLFPDASRPTVTVNLTIFVGSRHEGYGEAGMAHLLEHMLFKGTPDHPDIPKVLQERGARFNGTTWTDRTNYFETLPASNENLEFALRLEADRMVNSHIKGEDLASEMTVVRNEFERSENSASRVLRQRVTAVAFDWHNYGKSTIGNRSDIERVPLPKLRDFYRRFYQPDNAMVVVAGRFDEEKALGYVQKYFGSLPRPERKLDRTYTEEPAQDGQRTVELRRVGDVGLVSVAYHIPAGPHPEYAVVEVLGRVLATEPAGRLYKALVETKKATSISGNSVAWHDPGLLGMTATVRKENSLEEVRGTLIEEIERIGTEGVLEEEVERVKQQFLKSREEALADTRSVAIQLSNWAAQGDWRLYFLHRDRIKRVTAADVQEVAAKYLQQNNRTVGLFIPTAEPQRVAIPSRPDVTAMVRNYQGGEELREGEPFDPSPANVEARTARFELPGGTKVAFLPKKTRGETVHVQLTLRYGTADSLAGQNVASEVLPQLILRGTEQLSYQQLKDALDQNRVTLNGSGWAGGARFEMQTKRPHLLAALDLLQQVLRTPSLSAEEFELLRRERLASLEQAKTQPMALAFREFRRMVEPYSKNDVRYRPTVDEDIARTEAASLDQVKQLYDEFLGAQDAELVIVGDFDSFEVQQIIEEILSSWTAKQSYSRITEQAFPDVKTDQQAILTPDKANAVYAAGQTFAMNDSDPDYPALVIGNFILGGGFSSRLVDRVRRKEGFSYGVGSRLSTSALDNYSRVDIYAISNPENSPKVVETIAEEIELLLTDGITEEELALAKRGYLQSLTVRRTNDRTLTGILADTLSAERTMSYYADLEEKIQALTTEQVVTALRKRYDPKRLVVVTAGDFGNESAVATPQ
jgi:zinc protease